MFEVPLPSFGVLLQEQLLAPFFVFQAFCIGLWSLDDYWSASHPPPPPPPPPPPRARACLMVPPQPFVIGSSTLPVTPWCIMQSLLSFMLQAYGSNISCFHLCPLPLTLPARPSFCGLSYRLPASLVSSLGCQPLMLFFCSSSLNLPSCPSHHGLSCKAP